MGKEKQEERDAALPIAVAQLQAIGRAIQSDVPETIESIEVEYCGVVMTDIWTKCVFNLRKKS